jgi:hypothetical protein
MTLHALFAAPGNAYQARAHRLRVRRCGTAPRYRPTVRVRAGTHAIRSRIEYEFDSTWALDASQTPIVTPTLAHTCFDEGGAEYALVFSDDTHTLDIIDITTGQTTQTLTVS